MFMYTMCRTTNLAVLYLSFIMLGEDLLHTYSYLKGTISHARRPRPDPIIPWFKSQRKNTHFPFFLMGNHEKLFCYDSRLFFDAKYYNSINCYV